MTTVEAEPRQFVAPPLTARPAWPADWRVVALLLAFTLVHGALYAAVVPPWQVPDEYVHYEYLRGLIQAPTLFPTVVQRSAAIYQDVVASMRDFRFNEFYGVPTPADLPRRPPTPTIEARGGWSLYYRLSMPLYALVQTWPIVNQLYVLRLYSVLLQCVTVGLTYLLARLIFSGSADPAAVVIPAAAALVVAIFPQYTFISSGYNDDNLAPPLVAGSLYAALKGFASHDDYRWLALAGGLAFLAILTKRTAVSLLLLLALCLLAYALHWLHSNRQLTRAAGAAVIGLALAGALALLVIIVRPPQLPPRLAALLGLRLDDWSALTEYIRQPSKLLAIDWGGPLLFLSVSFWGWFGFLKVPLGTDLMEILRRATLVLIAGCGLEFVRRGLTTRPRFQIDFQLGALLLLGLGLVLSLAVLVAQFLIGPPVYALTGRYLFPFISAFGILAVWGWQAWWPGRSKGPGIVIGLALLVLVDFAAIALTITPFYYS